MATHATAKELRNMQTEDLLKEARSKTMLVSKMHIDVKIGSEKDTARYLREKKELARILTVLRERQLTEAKNTPKELKNTTKASTMPAPASAETGKKRRVSSSKK